MGKLTQARINEATPEEKDYYIWDDSVTGFGCRIYPSGHKTFILMYTSPLDKKRKTLKLGKDGSIDLEVARNVAIGYWGDIARGIDPKDLQIKKIEEKKIEIEKRKKDIKFEDFWKIFEERHMNHDLKLSTKKRTTYTANKHILPYFKDFNLDEISEKHILSFKDTIRHQKGTVFECLNCLKSCFRLAEIWGYMEPNSNIFKNIKIDKTEKKERYLSYSELSNLLSELEICKQDKRFSSYAIDALYFILYSGLRKNEVASLKWENIDFEENLINLEDSKVGKKTYPLNDKLVDLLNNIKKIPDCPYIFSGRTGNHHTKSINHVWFLIREKLNLTNVRIHDFRHSFASFAIKKGVPLVQISKLLGHSNISTTMRYVHLEMDDLKEASNKIAEVFK
jgi:integrase